MKNGGTRELIICKCSMDKCSVYLQYKMGQGTNGNKDGVMPKGLPIRIKCCVEWMGRSSANVPPYQSDDKDEVIEDNAEDVAVSVILVFCKD